MISALDHHDTAAESLEPIAQSPEPEFSFLVDTHIDFFTQRVPGDPEPGREGEQKRVRRLLAAIKDIHQAGRGKQNPTIKRLASAMQMPFNTLRRLYYAYTLGCEKAGKQFAPGDWRSVLNWSKVKSEKVNLAFAFLEFWRTLGENNQRKWKPAWDELLHILRTHHNFAGDYIKKIPGFDTWPEIDPVLGHPPGWSYENLMRHTSIDYDVTAARIGRSAASEHRLPVLRTRVGLRVGQEAVFDDHVFDKDTMFQKKPMRPLCFGVVDGLSDCLVNLGIKPTLWDPEKGVKLELTEREFLWFTLAYLCDIGYRRDKFGTIMNGERAKATWRDPWLTRLKAVLGPSVTFYMGTNAGNNSRAAHAGQFSGQAKGNFRTKAIVESKWNPLENQMASTRGQIGMDRDHRPAQIYGAEKYTGQVIRAAETQGVPLTDLSLPFDDFHTFCRLAHAAKDRLNDATDHNCQGWEDCGFTKKLWRTSESSPLWLAESDYAALSDLDRSIMARKLAEDRDGRLRKIEIATRREVFQAGRRELTRLDPAHIPEILGREFALNGGELKPVAKGVLRVDCDEIQSDPLYFYARDQHAAASHFIPNGEKFVCFVNPYLPTHLIACDDKLRVVAICPRYELAPHQNPEDKDMSPALKTALGAQGAMESVSRDRLNLRHDDESRRKRAMKERNDRLLTSATPVIESRPAVNTTADEILAREDRAEDPAETW